MILLSTKHRGPAVNEDEKLNPQIITDHNHCKCGVYNLDKVWDLLLHELIPDSLLSIIEFMCLIEIIYV